LSFLLKVFNVVIYLVASLVWLIPYNSLINTLKYLGEMNGEKILGMKKWALNNFKWGGPLHFSGLFHIIILCVNNCPDHGCTAVI